MKYKIFINRNIFNVNWLIESKLLKIREKELITSSYEVIGVVFSVLKRDGFKQILKSYIEFDN